MLNIYSRICSQTKKVLSVLFVPNVKSHYSKILSQLLFQKSAYFLPAIDKPPTKRVCLFKAILLVKTHF